MVRLRPARWGHVAQAVPDVLGRWLVTAGRGLVDESMAGPCIAGRPGSRRLDDARGRGAGLMSSSSAATKSGAIVGMRSPMEIPAVLSFAVLLWFA
jgi:hypothetical protein